MSDVSLRYAVPCGLVITKIGCDIGTAFQVSRYEYGKLVQQTPEIVGDGSAMSEFIALATALSMCPGIPVSDCGVGVAVRVRRDFTEMWQSRSAMELGTFSTRCHKVATNA